MWGSRYINCGCLTLMMHITCGNIGTRGWMTNHEALSKFMKTLHIMDLYTSGLHMRIANYWFYKMRFSDE